LIKLALEIPTSLLTELTPLTDLDFVLAHKVLEDEAYAEHYDKRPRNRTLILDNSMHELGHPLPPSRLAIAAEAVHADYVIAPDKLGEPVQNLEWYRETWRFIKHSGVAVVLSGRTKEERVEYARQIKGADMVCLPFREHRLQWMHELADFLTWCQTFHLLGVNELSELTHFRDEYSVLGKWSVDTAKPVKWGLLGQDMTKLLTQRGASITSKDLLNVASATPEQLAMIRSNVDFLRTCLA
jgi:hypothetical protein